MQLKDLGEVIYLKKCKIKLTFVKAICNYNLIISQMSSAGSKLLMRIEKIE
jgi:hypothetical protein